MGDRGANCALLAKTHLTSEGRVRNPLGGSAGSSLLHHLVNLLQSKALGLGNEEVGVDKGTSAKGAPEEEDLGAEVALIRVDHVWGDNGDDAVPEPVGGGGESDTAGTNWEGVDLANDDPGTRAPGGGEEEDVDADEGDHGGDGFGVVAVSDTNDGHNELADDHAESSPQKEGTTTNPLNGVERDGGGADVDDGGDHGQEEGVLDGAELLEESGAEVEDEVDTGPLLHHLEGGTEDSAADVRVGVEDVATEAVDPGLEVASLGDQGLLVLEVGIDLVELLLDEVGILGLVTDAGKGSTSLVLLALADEETRGLGEEEETSSEDQSPEQLESDGDAVGTRVGAVLGTVVDAGSQHESDGDAELVAGDDGTANLAGSDLRHVQDDDGGDEADTETSNETTGNEQTKAAGRSLKNNTNDEDEAASDDSSTATEPISEVTSDQSTKEGSSGENRDDEGLSGRGNHESGGTRFAHRQVFEGRDEVVHTDDTRDVTRVITEEDTTKGSESTHQVSLEGDGGLDASSVDAAPADRASTTGHLSDGSSYGSGDGIKGRYQSKRESGVKG